MGWTVDDLAGYLRYERRKKQVLAERAGKPYVVTEASRKTLGFLGVTDFEQYARWENEFPGMTGVVHYKDGSLKPAVPEVVLREAGFFDRESP